MTVDVFSNLTPIEEVWESFPEGIRKPKENTPAKFEAHVRSVGCGKEIMGKLFLGPEDVDDLLTSFRLARVVSHFEDILTDNFEMTQKGFVVIIGNPVAMEGYEDLIYVGWAPNEGNGAADLLELVDFGNPDPMAILAWSPATRDEVEEFRELLLDHSLHYRGHWFHKDTRLMNVASELRKGKTDALKDNDMARNSKETGQ